MADSSDIEDKNNNSSSLGSFKSLTSYFLNLLTEKYREYQERKRKTDINKLLKDIEKQFEIVEGAGSEKSSLTQSIRKTVDRYQEIVSSSPEPPQKPHSQKRVLQKQAASRVGSKMLKSLALNAKEGPSEYKPSQQELDAFRMKAITLMKKNGMLPETISEALKSPIQVNIGEVSEGGDTHLMIKFSQRFIRLGEEFELQGAFIKNAKKNSSHSIPISESFQLSPRDKD